MCYDSNIRYHIFARLKMTRFKGFTLAEVLITLGIIGVVAAMTLPILVNNYRAKSLETSFKKADTIISQAMQSTMFEYGFSRYYDFGVFCKGEYCGDTKIQDYDDINSFWQNQFSFVKATNWQEISSQNYQYAKFWGEKSNFNYVYIVAGNMNNPSLNAYFLKDGMLISEILFDKNNASEIGDNSHKYTIIPFIFVDTNGPKRGPNRLGYDMFYWIQMTCYFTYCDPLADNVRGCYLWARKDQNPYDSSVSYWKSLYKPKSYWEKLKNN